MQQIGNFLVLAGVVAIVAGLAIRFGMLSWFGNLPGDFRRVGERSAVFVPVTSMLLLSVVLTVLVNLLGRIFRG